MSERLQTLAKVAYRYQFTERRIRDLARQHGIPVLGSGRQVLFDRRALIALDDALRARPLTENERRYRDALYATEIDPKPLSGEGEVYFVATGTEVKIGVAKDPLARMATLQIGSAATLRLLGSMFGGADLERVLHRRFAQYRIRGEWYRLEGALAAFIAKQFGDA